MTSLGTNHPATPKSGGGPPHSKTLRAARKPSDIAERRGLRQSSGALIALILFLAPIAMAGTTNTLSKAELEGRALAQQLCNAWPAEPFSTSGTLQIRDRDGNRTNIPVIFQTLITPTNWIASYSASGDRTHTDWLLVAHFENQPNIYRKSNINRPPGDTNEFLQFPGNETSFGFAKSDFWLCDLGLEFFHWPQQKIIKREIKRSRGCAVLESTHPNPATNGYSRVVSWIDNESGGIVQAEAYDFRNKLLKEFAPKSFKKVNGQWELEEMEIRNVQTKSRTRLEFDLKK